MTTTTRPVPAVTNIPAPDGYTENHDSTVWNVGFVFWYSNVYEAWLEDAVISVRPGQTGSEALEERTDYSEWAGYKVFYSEST